MIKKNYTVNPDGTATITLSHKITYNGSTFSTLIMRRPKVKDILARHQMEANGHTKAEQDTWFYASLTSQDPDLIKELDLADYNSLDEVLTAFLKKQS